MDAAPCIKFTSLGELHPAWTLEDALDAYRNGGRVWLHMSTGDPEAIRDVLLNRLELHPVHVEDAISPYERPSVSFEEGYVFLVAPSISLDQGESYADVAIFVCCHSLITVSHAAIREVDITFQEMVTNPARHTGQPAGVLHYILDQIVDAYYPAVDRIAEQVDELEDLIFSQQKVDISDALTLKRRLLEMRRHVAPFRDVLSSLVRVESDFLDRTSLIYYQDIYDHANRVIELVDNERDIVSTVLDVHLAVQSNNLNQVMKSMTVISTLLMTGAFVAGVYGMNFKVMPELQWAYGYPFSFVIMFVLCALEVWFFKRNGWF